MALYKIEKEARGKLDKARVDMQMKFCPITKQNCNPHCICYDEGKIIEKGTPPHWTEENKKIHLKDGKWLMYEPLCTSPIISGKIEVIT